MNTSKKIMLTIMMIASYATISASGQKYTANNIAAWIDQVNLQAKNMQNTLSPTDANIIDTSTLLTTMQSNLLATPDGSVQQGQIGQLQAGIRALQVFLNKYAYSFTNNAPFSVNIQSAAFNKIKNAQPVRGITNNDQYFIQINPAITSAVQYSLTPFSNVLIPSPTFNNNPARFESDNSQNTDKNGATKYLHYSAPKANASYDIVTIPATYTPDKRQFQISLTKTSDSGKNYTNKTGYKIKMSSKPKGHSSWQPFELDLGQSTGKASNDGMERVHIYTPESKDMPKASTTIPSLAPGKYAINYDKTKNQLSLDLVA